MPDPIQPSTRAYLDSVAVACEYDDYFQHTALFDYDATLLDRWLPRPGRLLDIGCGSGRHVLQFARAGFDVTGVDLSSYMLKVTRRKLSDAGLRAHLIQADITDLPTRLRSASFDYALCMFSTFGLIAGHDNRAAALYDWNHLLKPGGLLVMHVHNRWHDLGSPDGWAFLVTSAVRALSGRGEWGDKYIPHYRGIRNMYIHLFSQRELIHLLNGTGFEVIELIALNEQRNGPLRPGRTVPLRANGYIALARRAGP